MNPTIEIHALYLVFEAENIIFLIIYFSNHFPVQSKDIKEATELSDGRVYVRLSWNTFAVVERYSRAIWCWNRELINWLMARKIFLLVGWRISAAEGRVKHARSFVK